MGHQPTTAVLVLAMILIVAGCSRTDSTSVERAATNEVARPHSVRDVQQAFRRHGLPLYELGPPDLGFRVFGTTRTLANFGVEVHPDSASATAHSGSGYFIDVEPHTENVVERRLGNIRVVYDTNQAGTHRRVKATIAALAKG